MNEWQLPLCVQIKTAGNMSNMRRKDNIIPPY